MNKPGYKQTPLGWIPEDWEVKRLEEISAIKQGVSKGRLIATDEAITVPYMRVANVKDGEIDLTEIKEITIHKDELSKYTLEEGDILITEGGDPDKLGRGGIWNNSIENCVFQNHLFRIRVSKKKLSYLYLYNFFQGFKAKTYFLSCAKQTTGIASINSSQVKATPIPLPPLSEQRRIATILSTWDAGIAKEQQLIDALQTRHRALMQQLLSGKKRLKGFRGKWKEVKLGDVFTERNEIGYCDLPLMSITANRGVIYQSENDKKNTSNEDKSKYRRICIGDIGYNTMRMWQGRSALSALEGIVSPAYTIATPNKDQCAEFHAALLKAPFMINRFFCHSQGLVEDTLNCKYKDFAIVKVSIPKIDEQNAIATILNKSDQEIQTHRRRLAAIKQQKKGLMQVLLTGKVRVKTTKP